MFFRQCHLPFPLLKIRYRESSVRVCQHEWRSKFVATSQGSNVSRFDWHFSLKLPDRLLDTRFEFHARFEMWQNVFYLPGCKGSSTTTVYHCPPSAVSDGTPAAMYDRSKTAVSDGTTAVLQLHSTPTRTAGVQFHPEATMQHSSKVQLKSPWKIALATKASHCLLSR